MLICPDKRYIFFKPLKCAGTSVEHALFKQTSNSAVCSGDNEYLSQNNVFHYKGDEYQKFMPHTYPECFYNRTTDCEVFKDYYHITIIRNPWDALVSYYWWCVREGGGLFTKTNSNELFDRMTIKSDDSIKEIKQKFQLTMTSVGRYDNDALAHELRIAEDLASPTTLFGMANSKFLDSRINQYLRYENLDNDYANLCSQLKIQNNPLPRYKSKLRKYEFHYSDYYTDSMKEEVRYYFSAYIENFGYEFNVGV